MNSNINCQPLIHFRNYFKHCSMLKRKRGCMLVGMHICKLIYPNLAVSRCTLDFRDAHESCNIKVAHPG